MIIPLHWAEARHQHRAKGKQVTVRRFGWSDLSIADAQTMAEARAEEALQRILSGEPSDRREKKVPYNGAEGVPIREEILSRHGDTIISRNSYGAHCLNTPTALFADVDHDSRPPSAWFTWSFIGLLCLSAMMGWQWHSVGVALMGAFISLLSASGLASGVHAANVRRQGGAESIARRRIAAFLTDHPGWAVRIYRTPAGLRVLATHQPFSAEQPEVEAFFKAIGADPQYARMCQRQNCFRARLSAKPWRIGIAAHMRPRPGVWPVNPEHLPVRKAWIAQYEAKAASFAACQFLGTLGSGVEHIDIRPVIELHDRESRALVAGLPLA